MTTTVDEAREALLEAMRTSSSYDGEALVDALIATVRGEGENALVAAANEVIYYAELAKERDILIAAVRAESAAIFDTALTDAATESRAESAETLRALRAELISLHIYGIESGAPLLNAQDIGWNQAIKVAVGLVNERIDATRAALAATQAEDER